MAKVIGVYDGIKAFEPTSYRPVGDYYPTRKLNELLSDTMDSEGLLDSTIFFSSKIGRAYYKVVGEEPLNLLWIPFFGLKASEDVIQRATADSVRMWLKEARALHENNSLLVIAYDRVVSGVYLGTDIGVLTEEVSADCKKSCQFKIIPLKNGRYLVWRKV